MFHPVYMLAMPHSQTHGLMPASMADRSLVSTTDCILLNRSNYRKENKPEIVKPSPPSEALPGVSALFLTPVGVSYMQV